MRYNYVTTMNTETADNLAGTFFALAKGSGNRQNEKIVGYLSDIKSRIGERDAPGRIRRQAEDLRMAVYFTLKQWASGTWMDEFLSVAHVLMGRNTLNDEEKHFLREFGVPKRMILDGVQNASRKSNKGVIVSSARIWECVRLEITGELVHPCLGCGTPLQGRAKRCPRCAKIQTAKKSKAGVRRWRKKPKNRQKERRWRKDRYKRETARREKP